MFSAPTFQDKDRKEDDDDDDDDDKGDDEERRRKKKTRTVFSRSQVNYRKRVIGIFTWANHYQAKNIEKFRFEAKYVTPVIYESI